MSDPLHDFYMGALEAELTCAPRDAFSASMAAYHCRTLLALEANPKDGTAERSALPREAPKPNSSETVAATGLEADPGCKKDPSNG